MTQSLNPSQTSAGLTLSGSNLIATKNLATGVFQSSVALQLVAAGKWYWEGVPTVTGAGANSQIGIATTSFVPTGNYVGSGTTSVGCVQNALIFYNAASTSGGVNWSAGNVIGVAWDATTGKIWWNNFTIASGWVGTAAGDPVAETNGYSVPFVGTAAAPAIGSTNTAATGDSWTMRFLASSFTGTIPTGYLAADLMGALFVPPHKRIRAYSIPILLRR